MIRSADHALDGQSRLFRDLNRRLYEHCITDGGRVEIQTLHREFNLAARADFFHSGFNLHQRRIARLHLRVAQINLQLRPARHAIHCAGFDAENARRANGVRAARVRCGVFDS